MNWLAEVDNYCERLGPGLWAEPLNAVTNFAFMLAALLLVRRARGDGMAMALVVVLFAIGVGSLLFHTFAQRWAGLADVLPILVFILVYIYAATTRFLGQRWWVGLAVAVLFLPVSGVVGRGIMLLFGPLNGSVGYIPVALIIAIYAVMLARRSPATARGLAIGSGLLALSLTFRSLDASVCTNVPFGTHFMWHILNAVMLGWMILTLIRHRQLAPIGRGG